jgi:hypothetical protein
MNTVEKLVKYQFKPLAICPLPPRPTRILVIDKKTGKKNYRYEQEITKTFGNITVRIIASKKYGLPHGRDILVILFFIQMAIDQNNNGLIKIKDPLKAYLEMFGLEKNKQSYSEAKTRFNRIRHSTFNWEDEKDKGNRQGQGQEKKVKGIDDDSISYQIIKGWSVSFDDVEQRCLFESYIQLDDVFWKYISKKKIPYDLKTVIKLKDRISVLNIYLWMIFRAYEIWMTKGNEPVFIPLFGPNGLMLQMSSNIKRKEDFKNKLFSKYLPKLKEVWEDCPLYLEKENHTHAKDLSRKKKYKDGIFIQVKSVNQLHIPPHWQKMLRLAREEAAANQENQEIDTKKQLKAAENELERIDQKIKSMKIDMNDPETLIKSIKTGMELDQKRQQLNKQIEELKELNRQIKRLKRLKEREAKGEAKGKGKQ